MPVGYFLAIFEEKRDLRVRNRSLHSEIFLHSGNFMRKISYNIFITIIVLVIII